LSPADWSAIYQVYEAACDLPLKDRTTFVESALGDERLRSLTLDLLTRLEESEESHDPMPPPAAHEHGPQLLPGSFLGRFRILEEIGRGGMGEVYRAVDTDLDRNVAIKCIAGRRLGPSSAVANFIREARMASALNHPGIVTIYEVIRTRDTVAIVMELMEGESLRKRCGTPQPIERVAAWGRQIAAALTELHAAGLMHRDIKPENLVLRSEGYVKILDFGLALHHTETQDPDEGRVAGTLRYMSPEQARGGELSPATDVFSLGIVLYELAAGVHPFVSGTERASTLTVAQAIAMAEAPARGSRTKALPVWFTELVEAMMSPRSIDRPSAADVAARLSEAAAVRPAGRWSYLLASAAAAVLALAFAVYWYRAGDRVGAQTSSLRVAPFTTYQGAASQPSFSPDGSRIAFAWTGPDGTNRDIYWQAIGETQPHRLTTDPAEDLNPAFSPDGRQIAFFRQTAADPKPRVIVAPLDGGPERLVGQVSALFGYRGMDWLPDGKALLVRDALTNPSQASVVRLSLEDGSKAAFSSPPESQADGMPLVSPDGTRVAFLRYHTDSAEICWTSVSGGEVRCVVRNKSLSAYAWRHDGRAIYYADGSALWCVDLRGGLRNPPVKLTDGLFRDLAADRTGRHLAFSRGVSDTNLWKIGRDGRPASRIVASSGEDSDPAWSPDGREIVMRSSRSGSYELYVYKSDGTGERQITHFGAHLGNPRWSPDGAWIAFDGNRAPIDPAITHHNVYVIPSHGGEFRRITDDRYNYTTPSWSPDGQWIYFSQLSQPAEVRKKLAAGGETVAVGEGAGDLVESSDGQYFYFTHVEAPGIWRRPVAGGPEALMPGTGGVQMYRYWDLIRDGLFFVDPAPRPTLRFLDFRRSRVEKIAELSHGLFYGPRALSASPDGKSVVYALQDIVLGDILLIEGLKD
jgi:Tol biopolymer transport system component